MCRHTKEEKLKYKYYVKVIHHLIMVHLTITFTSHDSLQIISQSHTLSIKKFL